MPLQRIKFLFSFSGFLSALYFSIPIWMVFLTVEQHFSVETAIQLSMLEWLVIAVFEVWSGSWSDRFGRRKIFALGWMFQILATTIYVFGHGLPIFLFSALSAGIGGAMMSGNIEAIVHDRLMKLGDEAQFSKMQSQSYMWRFIGRTFGAIAGGYLFSFNPIFPYMGNLAIFTLYTTTIFLFPKDEQEKSHSKSDFEHIRIGFSDIWMKKSIFYKLLLIILAASVGNIYWFTYQEYFRLLWLPVASFGWFYALTSSMSALSAWLLWRSREKGISERILFRIFLLFLASSSVFLAFSHELWSLVGIVTLSCMSGWVMTLGNTLILAHVAPTHKSFALSAFSFAQTMGYVICTYTAGFFIERYGLWLVYSFLSVSILSGFIFWIVYSWSRK